MKRSLIVVLAVLLVASFAYAGMKTYQVTGPVLEVTPTTITVQKGKDKWEIARDNGTKVSGDLKVGSKVTIQYEMKAASIEVKEEKKKGK
jgi:LysM repeat protein